VASSRPSLESVVEGIAAVEAEMRRIGMWDVPAPTDEERRGARAFGIPTLSSKSVQSLGHWCHRAAARHPMALCQLCL
jgi:hypothetical protein